MKAANSLHATKKRKFEGEEEGGSVVSPHVPGAGVSTLDYPLAFSPVPLSYFLQVHKRGNISNMKKRRA